MSQDHTVADWRRIALTKAIHAVLAASGMHHSSGGTTQMTKAKGNRTMTKENKSLTARDTEIENISTAAREDGGFEKLLKFNKGDFLIGDEKIPLGAEFIAHVPAWMKTWIKFLDGKPVDNSRKVYRVALGEQPPEREELDDWPQNENWPDGIDGEPSDPWVFQNLLPLENLENSEVIIFASPSSGGKIAIGNLSTAYTRRAKKKPDCGLPIVKLATATFPSKKYGKVLRPDFEIVGWDEPSADSDIEVMPPASSKNEPNDEVPF